MTSDMASDPSPDQIASADDFLTTFRGSFTSALRWPQLDDLWLRMRERADAGWYIYAIGEPPPATPTDAAGVEAFIAEIDALLRKEHDEGSLPQYRRFPGHVRAGNKYKPLICP